MEDSNSKPKPKLLVFDKETHLQLKLLTALTPGQTMHEHVAAAVALYVRNHKMGKAVESAIASAGGASV